MEVLTAILASVVYNVDEKSLSADQTKDQKSRFIKNKQSSKGWILQSIVFSVYHEMAALIGFCSQGTSKYVSKLFTDRASTPCKVTRTGLISTNSILQLMMQKSGGPKGSYIFLPMSHLGAWWLIGRFVAFRL